MSSGITHQTAANDCTSSVYSRSLGSLRPSMNEETQVALVQEGPEINPLDHQIAMSRGSTIALETLPSRLQRSKREHELSPSQLRNDKLRQWEQQQHENEFYALCRSNFLEISQAVVGLSQEITLQYHFEPEMDPVGDIRLLRAIESLRAALENSRNKEAQAEHAWRRYWNLSRVWSSSGPWI
ncbi:hypothetical protein N7478_000656 [Penicillium angulare]|uniref:uncharacterized protein n=1 Tax=Penicillium angulare TaxID=116970 RepID=UPI0025414936|nr:uncharacterized protein N7478_000656 [Penicillium angulare]KAJ5291405.1 hypothetical protein N7478_000656 [Penicillium angulare]